MENKKTNSSSVNKQTTTKTTTQTKKLSDVKTINNQNKTTSNNGQKVVHTELSQTQKNANSSQKHENNTTKSSNNENKLQNSNSNQSFKKSAHPAHKVKNRWLILLAFVGGTILVGLLSSLLGGKMREDYIKPPAYPADIVFTIAWCILYIAIGYAAYNAYFSQGSREKRKMDIIWYCVHLFFNLFWTLIFFRLDMLIFATIWLALMIITSIIVTYRYYRSNLTSGIIFTIYTLWLIYAMYLTLAITLLNVAGAV